MSASTSDLEALLARVMEAEGPDRYLDAAIWKALHPDLHDTNASDTAGWLTGGNHREPTKTPALSASLDACHALQEQVLPGWRWQIGTMSGRDGLPYAQLAEPIATEYGPGIGMRAQCYGATEPLAWLAAILRALIAQSKEQADAGR